LKRSHGVASKPSTERPMTDSIEIRTSSSGDLSAIEALYPDAFPSEDLLPLVRELLRELSTTISLVALAPPAVVGHVMFTRCSVEGSACKVALLGPLAVATAYQRKGFGSALVCSGLRRLTDAGFAEVCVLGDPAYYRRLGFRPSMNILAPYPLPAAWRDAWQSIHIGRTEAPCRGVLVVPPLWRQPALWAPQ
jgi:putative acetyltransferase